MTATKFVSPSDFDHLLKPSLAAALEWQVATGTIPPGSVERPAKRLQDFGFAYAEGWRNCVAELRRAGLLVRSE